MVLHELPPLQKGGRGGFNHNVAKINRLVLVDDDPDIRLVNQQCFRAVLIRRKIDIDAAERQIFPFDKILVLQLIAG